MRNWAIGFMAMRRKSLNYTNQAMFVKYSLRSKKVGKSAMLKLRRWIGCFDILFCITRYLVLVSNVARPNGGIYTDIEYKSSSACETSLILVGFYKQVVSGGFINPGFRNWPQYAIHTG